MNHIDLAALRAKAEAEIENAAAASSPSHAARIRAGQVADVRLALVANIPALLEVIAERDATTLALASMLSEHGGSPYCQHPHDPKPILEFAKSASSALDERDRAVEERAWRECMVAIEAAMDDPLLPWPTNPYAKK